MKHSMIILAWMKKMHDVGKILFSGPAPDPSIGIIVVKEDLLDSARHMMIGSHG
jgi:uncharacterized protein YciI